MYTVGVANRFAGLDLGSDDESPKQKKVAPKKETAVAPASTEKKAVARTDEPRSDNRRGGRGGARGGRGGFGSRPEGEVKEGEANGVSGRGRGGRVFRERGGRDYDRHTPGVNNQREEKKHGGGAHNWGNDAADWGADEGAEGEQRPFGGRGRGRGGRGRGGRGRGGRGGERTAENKDEETEEKPAEEGAAEQEGEEGEAKSPKAKSEKGEKEPAEPPMVDYEVYLKEQAAKRANLPKLPEASAKRTIAPTMDGYVLKMKEPEKPVVEEESEEEENDASKKKKKAMHLAEWAAESGASIPSYRPPGRGGRGGARGGRGGREGGSGEGRRDNREMNNDRPRRGRGGFGGNRSTGPTPNIEDTRLFPTLGGK